MNRSSRKTNVYYLPVGLTNFQRDLVEILVSLHARSFEKEVNDLDGHENGNGNSNATMYPQLSDKQMMYMFDHNVRAVANHPCLLVDHYMPRQFLRMEPNEKLINGSDKFQKLQQLLYNMIHRDRSKYPDVLKIALISHSVRELDLLEGLILGETVRMKRLSGTSLYDEKHVYFEDSPNGTQDPNDSKDGTPSVESGSNSYTGYPRDDYDYSAKRQRRAKSAVAEDWLFLTTTNHLINDPSLLCEYDCDYIISFDPLLDPSLPALAHLSNKGNKRVPIIKLLVVDSPDHYILENMLHSDAEHYDDLKNSMKYFLRTRHSSNNINVSMPIDYRQVVQLLLSGDPLTSALPDIELSGVDDDVDLYKLQLSELNYSNSNLTIDENVHDMKSYQSELMKRTVERLMQIQHECKENSNIIGSKRARETERQNMFDEMKQEIGIKFKKFEDSKKMKDDLEKRLERSQTESEKLDKRLQTIQNIKKELELLLALDQDEDVEKKINSYDVETKRLQAAVNELAKTNEEKNIENENLRGEYQMRSSLAVEAAQTVEVLKSAVERSEKDVAGPATKLELNSLLAQEKDLAEQQHLIKDKAKFLRLYINKMTTQYGIKLCANGNLNSQQASTPSNSRSATLASRHKSMRSNTPTYT